MMSVFASPWWRRSFIVRREKLRAATRSPHRLVALEQTRPSFWCQNYTLDATEFFWLPPNRVVELGGQVEI